MDSYSIRRKKQKNLVADQRFLCLSNMNVRENKEHDKRKREPGIHGRYISKT